jgi:predicted extracellular nuclease
LICCIAFNAAQAAVADVRITEWMYSPVGSPGESVIFTEATADAFRAAWNLSSGVKVIGGSVNNLGRSDEVNLYDASSALVDRLTYNDQGTGTVKVYIRS